MKTKIIAYCIGGFIIAGLLFCLAFPVLNCRPQSRGISWAHALFSQIRFACDAFYQEYGALPSSSENYILTDILGGNNPRKIVFMEYSPRLLNNNKEMIDAWGTPIRVVFLPDQKFFMVSAGKDKIFNTKDDVTNQ